MFRDLLFFLLLIIFFSLVIYVTVMLLGFTDDLKVCVKVSDLLFICE